MEISANEEKCVDYSESDSECIIRYNELKHKDLQSVTFNQIDYLGTVRIDDPLNENQMLSLLTTLALNSNDERKPNVILQIPISGNGKLMFVVVDVLIGATSAAGANRTIRRNRSIMRSTRFDIYIVRLFEDRFAEQPSDCETRLQTESSPSSSLAIFSLSRVRYVTKNTNDCIAFTYTLSRRAHSLHALRCQVPEAVDRILCCLAAAFQAPPIHQSLSRQSSVRSSITTANQLATNADDNESEFTFDSMLDLFEIGDVDRSFAICPHENGSFKIRKNRIKQLRFAVSQSAGAVRLQVKKCFGVLLAPGRNVKNADMHLLEIDSDLSDHMEQRDKFHVSAIWDPNGQYFEALNTETPRDTRVFVTLGVDVVFTEIREPIRFVMQFKVRVYHEHERFWQTTSRPLLEQFYLTTKEMNDDESSEKRPAYEIVQFESATQRERSMQHGRVRLPDVNGGAAQLIQPCDDNESDGDEPLLSGSGAAEKPQEVNLDAWQQIIDEYKSTLSKPAALEPLLLNEGLPDSLRKDIWPLLATTYCGQDFNASVEELATIYESLHQKDCLSEAAIERDMHRTFPAHEYFKDPTSKGQNALRRLARAYCAYDTEVGYVQGLSFLAAALLLHLPEEMAFYVLVQIMYKYSLRESFKKGFDALHLQFYQLQRLIEDYQPSLAEHFYSLQIETHMFASQWFLTLFTAKFPLTIAYYIIDLFLAKGMITLFHIALALLQASQNDLLNLDFEGVLKYFRVGLPRKYRTDDLCRQFIKSAITLQISPRRIDRYRLEYKSIKQYNQSATSSCNPADRTERERIRSNETILRLERENDDLAHELVTVKVDLQKHLEVVEDTAQSLRDQVECLSRVNSDLNDENKQLKEESEKIRDISRKEFERLEAETERQALIINKYKQICSDLSKRLESRENENYRLNQKITTIISTCASCSILLKDVSVQNESNVNDSNSNDDKIRRLELELAKTKLAFVESECRNQDLIHQVTAFEQDHLMSNQSKGSAWLRKALNWSRDNAQQANALMTKSFTSTTLSQEK